MLQLAALLQLHALLAFLSLLVTWNWESWSSCIFEIWVGSKYGLHRWPLRCNWGDHSLVKLTLLFLQCATSCTQEDISAWFACRKEAFYCWYDFVKLAHSKLLGWSDGTQLLRSDQDLDLGISRSCSDLHLIYHSWAVRCTRGPELKVASPNWSANAQRHTDVKLRPHPPLMSCFPAHPPFLNVMIHTIFCQNLLHFLVPSTPHRLYMHCK